MPGLLLIALATLASEDATCIGAGILIAHGMLGFWQGTVACLLGIFAGDLMLFFAGRLAGRRALNWKPFHRLVTGAQLDRATDWLTAKGSVVVVLSRFTPGLRLPTYFAAGMLKTDVRRFALYFLAAAAVWTPLLVGLAALFRVRMLGPIFEVPALFAAFWLLKTALRFRTRRKIVGFLKRIVGWEFWPVWAAYLPVVPYFGWLALKHRSLTLFTAANPGIPSGGLVGESKSAILARLSNVPAWSVIPSELGFYARAAEARKCGFGLPVVLKPDIGERGSGVAIIRSDQELESYLRSAEGDTIIQRYVSGREFGVFYYRYPDEPRGHVLSITEKRFPQLTGDGWSTVEELILKDERAVCLAATYTSRCRRPLDEVPAAGERVPISEIGSHCRGSIFADASSLVTPSLETAIDRISQSFPGFFIGRYDLRVPSIEALQQGVNLQVIELNGVSAEATHIYDPAVSLMDAYRVLFRHWRMAFEIGSLNRARGARPMTVAELVKLVWTRRRGSRATPRSESILPTIQTAG